MVEAQVPQNLVKSKAHESPRDRGELHRQPRSPSKKNAGSLSSPVWDGLSAGSFGWGVLIVPGAFPRVTTLSPLYLAPR